MAPADAGHGHDSASPGSGAKLHFEHPGARMAKQMRRKLTTVNDECRRGSLRWLVEFAGCAGDRLVDAERGRKSLVCVVDLVPRNMSTLDSVERALDLLQGVKRQLILPGKA